MTDILGSIGQISKLPLAVSGCNSRRDDSKLTKYDQLAKPTVSYKTGRNSQSSFLTQTHIHQFPISHSTTVSRILCHLSPFYRSIEQKRYHTLHQRNADHKAPVSCFGTVSPAHCNANFSQFRFFLRRHATCL